MPQRLRLPGSPTRHAPLVLSVVTLLLAAAPAAAKPAHKQALIDFLGAALPQKLHNCQTCHLPDPPNKEGSEKPHNPFGLRLLKAGDELHATGKKADIPSRLLAVAAEDADGDGVPNIVELLAGSNPGDPASKPTAAEITVAKQKWDAFRKELAETYAWRPFEPVKRPALPEISNPKYAIRNPVDLFLAAEHQRNGLTPRPEAPRHVVLRRLYLDLIGLPPTREELHAFLADASPQAYEKVVDRLLASPQYGERWGRHWMDVWRYSDWAGYGAEVRDSQPHIWHWRDWIVESLNADKGYDQMVREMLAADELTPTDEKALRATGFLARNWYKFNRNVWLDRIVEHTGKAFLGVTLNCARCHDHFFDPIGQKEYYAFRAIFEPHTVRTDRVPGQPDTKNDGLPRVYDSQPTAPTYLFVRGNELTPDKSQTIPPAVPACLGGRFEVRPVTLPPAAVSPEKRPEFEKDARAATRKAVEQAEAARAAAGQQAASLAAPPGGDAVRALLARVPAWLRASDQLALAEADTELARLREAALAAMLKTEKLEDAGHKGKPEWKESATETQRLQRQATVAEARRNLAAWRVETWTVPAAGRAAPGKKLPALQTALTKAEAALKQPPTTAYTPRPLPTYPATSTGRRAALARWITDPQNPLTARVAVNHIWLRHFGAPLVPTVFDFGQNGLRPTHPALLDWLAAEFVEHKWSMKHLHRLIVTSAAYRMDSSVDPVCVKKDPDNRWLWRMNVRRMEAEAVRDSLLAVSGKLDRTLGGPDLDHNLGLTLPRRSLYFRHAPEKQMTFLALFDAANMVECYRRTESIVPQQALALANSTLALAQARVLAGTLARECPEQASFLRTAFEQVLGRPPTDAEQETCVKFLAEQTTLLKERKGLTTFTGSGPACPVPPAADPQQRAREDLVHVLLNHHEFVTIR
jgi:hypothetical protein